MVPMRRTVVLAAIWIVVAIGAVTIAWQGVGVVGNQVTDDRPAPLAASEIESRLAEASTTTSAPGAAGTSSSTTPSTTAAAAPVVPGNDPGAAGPNVSPTSQPGPAPTAATTPPSTAPPAAETRTYNLHGGTASLRFSPSGVTVVFANPAPGFAVSVEPEHGNGVKVEFESDTHESRVDGWWENGPVDRVQEEAD